MRTGNLNMFEYDYFGMIYSELDGDIRMYLLIMISIHLSNTQND